MPDYLPTREAELLAWSANWAEVTSLSPESYGLTAQQSTYYQSLHDAFATAYAVTQGPNRGPVATQTKNTAKRELIRGEGGIRQLVGIVQNFPGTTDTMRVQLKITVGEEPTPIPPPEHAPEIDFMPTATRTIRIRLHNEHTLGHSGRPPGVAGATVFSYIGEEAPIDLNEWKFEENTTRTMIDIDMPPTVPSGTKVWFTAFWRNPRDQSGPGTTPISTIVQWGGMAKAA
jgi:hypothetical protein